MLGLWNRSTPHYLYPDTTVSCAPGDSELDNLLEVLSLGTEAKDRGAKFKSYQLWPSIQEIVLINQFAPLIEVWRRNDDDPDNVKAWFYRRYGPGNVVDLASIEVRVALEACYRGLTFDGGEEEHAGV